MKTKSLAAAPIDRFAQHLSDTPITPPASARKAGDNLALLLFAGIGRERAAVTITSIIPADTFDQAEAQLIFVLKYCKNDPVAEATPAVAEEPKTAIALIIGKRRAILDQAQTDALPPAPDLPKPTHATFRAKLALIVALAETGDIPDLQVFQINLVPSRARVMVRHCDLCVIAITACAPVAAWR